MKTKLLTSLALVLIGILLGVIIWLFLNPSSKTILRRMSNYYQGLNGFEGTNTITDQFRTHPLTRTRQFAFLRPNQFCIRPDSTNDSELMCDGTNFFDYRPYYFNSYTKVPAPGRFEAAFTNWAAGELVYLMVHTNRYQYIMSGFGWGLITLTNLGTETVNGVRCHHLLLKESGSRTSELWIHTGWSPFIVKYVFQYRDTKSANHIQTHTEVISGWRVNDSVSPEQFAFAPPAGAILHPPGADEVEMSYNPKTGVSGVRFYAREDSKKLADRLQPLAIKSILAKYPDLTTNDLVFNGIQHFPGEETAVVSYKLPETTKPVTVNGSHQIKPEAVEVKLTLAGEIQSVNKIGYTKPIRIPLHPSGAK